MNASAPDEPGGQEMYNFWRKQKWSPVQPKRDIPEMASAWLFTLRSVPHHFDEIKAAIESTGDARVWFGEPLAYIEGRGVALFRVEATGFTFLPNLYDFWAEAERNEATGFDIRLYTQNKQLAGSLRGLTLQQAESLIKEHARQNQAAGAAVS
jgi:hypothetical protein